MFSEDNRKFIVEDMHNNINFKFGEYTPPVNVYRYGESYDEEFPYVLMEFLPANRNKFRSISDVIGNATPNGMYKQYGFCQIEVININCYCGEFHNNWELNGRDLTYHLTETVLSYVLRNWEKMLWDMYASLDRAETLFAIKDLSYYDNNKASKIYCYSFDVYVRTQMRWDKIPLIHVEEEIVEGISEVWIRNQTEEDYKLIS